MTCAGIEKHCRSLSSAQVRLSGPARALQSAIPLPLETVFMRLIHAIATISIGIVPFVTACHAQPAAHGGNFGVNSSVHATVAAVIEKSGFGGSRGYLWVTSIVRDVPVGQFATVFGRSI